MRETDLVALGDDIRVNREKQLELMEQVATVAREAAKQWAAQYTDRAKQVVIEYIDGQIADAMTRAQQYVDGKIKTLATDRINSLILHNNLKP